MPLERIAVDGERPDPARVDQATSALQQGRCVVLPTETVYGFAAVPDNAAAVAALRSSKGREAQQPFTYHVADRAQVEAVAQPLHPRVQRLVARFWPGPLTIIVAGRIAPVVGLRMPAHGFTRAVLRAFPHGLFMTSVNRSGEPALLEPEAIAAGFPSIDLLFDAGRPPLGKASTIVRAQQGRLTVEREGILTRNEILRAAAATCLFVCTGNTCRSPMAEALARSKAARALAVPVAELRERGLVFGSAGISTFGGMPANEGAERAMEEIGIDLRAHVSTQLTAGLAERAARIYCLTAAHRDRLVELLPEESVAKVALLGGEHDIADPFGGDLSTYRSTRDVIAAAIDARLDEIVALAEA